MEGIKVNVTTDNNEVVIRQGQALPLAERLIVRLSGTLFCVQEYLLKYKEKVSENAIIEVDRDEMSIKYLEDPTDHFGTRVFGKLVLTKEFQTFGINAGTMWQPKELADLIRLNRSFFEPTSAAAELVKDLRNFKAKIDTEVEKSDDKRANTTLLRRQAVESNLPASFKMALPIFKGTGTEVVEVEVDIDPDSLNCQLVSPMAAEIIQTRRDKLIDAEIDSIRELVEDAVPIIEK